jgi:hypothetical protein
MAIEERIDTLKWLRETGKLSTFTFFINKRKPWQRSIVRNDKWDKVREITCYGEEANKILAEINEILLALADKDLHKDQWGFRPNRGTLDIVQVQAAKAICIDLQDAFHNLKRKRIRRILSRYTTAKQAEWLARNMTPHGKMFQGHPIAPLMLNLALVESLKNIEEIFGNTLMGYHYADDLNFFVRGNFTKEVLYSITAKILEVLKSQGFKVNKKKIHVFNKNIMFTLGLLKEYKLGYHTATYVIRGRRKLKRKVRMFVHWLEKGREHTQRKSKDGIPISTCEVLNGIRLYLNNVDLANKNPKTFRKVRRRLERKFQNILKSIVAYRTSKSAEFTRLYNLAID